MDNQKRNRLLITGVIVILVAVAVFYFIDTRESQQLGVGIIQIVEHPALDSAREGFKDVLDENGFVEDENITYDYQNAQGDMSTAKTIAQKFNRQELDLILAIATPTSQAAANTIEDIPILITAVTDPVEAGLVDSMENPGGNLTGTTDMTPIAKQLELLLEIQSDTEDLGVIYNAGESNSVVQAEITKEECERLDINLIESTADNSSGVHQAAQSLADKVDAFYVFTDNTVVSALESVIKVAEENEIPLIVGEEDSVERGGLATEGISYYELGRQTGEMALKIINDDADPADMPIESQKSTRLVINESAAEAMGVTLSDELKERADKTY